MTAATQTVREVAQTQPSSIRVFEQFGIDYCCGGRKPLKEACAAKDLDVDTVIQALEAALQSEQAQDRDWTTESLSGLTEHIVQTHHAYCRRELPRLSGLAVRVVNRHGGTNPELSVIREKLTQLADELTDHLAEEEIVTFPLIVELESQTRGATGPGGSKVSLSRPVASLIEDHENAGVLLAEIRSLSRHFIAPEYACTTYHAFFDGLRDFERDLHRHVHLENNILFPRAIELEKGSAGSAAPPSLAG